jgi:hypothetical protein
LIKQEVKLCEKTSEDNFPKQERLSGVYKDNKGQSESRSVYKNGDIARVAV